MCVCVELPGWCDETSGGSGEAWMLVVDFPFLYLILIDWIGFVANWQNRYREGRCLFLSLKHLTDGEEEGCRCRCIYLARHTVVLGHQFEKGNFALVCT